MPILVLAARLCPPGLESTIYSVLLSAYNLGLGLGSLVSAGLTAVREPVKVKYPVLLFSFFVFTHCITCSLGINVESYYY